MRYFPHSAAQDVADRLTAETGEIHLVCSNPRKGGFTVRPQSNVEAHANVRKIMAEDHAKYAGK